MNQIKNDFEKALKLIKKEHFSEGEKILIGIENNHYNELIKSQKISLFVNYAKVNIHEKKYSLALDNLLKAKTLNIFDSLQFQKVYNSTFAELFFEIGAYDLSINYFQKYLQSENDQLNRFFAFNRIGTLQLHLSKTKEALESFSQQFEMSENFKHKVSHFSALNNMALVYLREKKYKQALKMFLIVEENVKDVASEKSFYFVVRGNIGRTYYWLKEYNKSLPYLKDYFDFTFEDKDYLNEFNLQKLYGKALIKDQKIPLAKEIVQKISSDYNQMKVLAKIDFINLEMALNNALENSKLVSENADEMELVFIDYKREQKIEHNIASNIVSQYLISEAKAKIEIKKKEEKFLLSQKRILKKERSLLLILIGALCIFIVITIIVYFQQIKNRKIKIELDNQAKLLVEEKEKLKLEYIARNQ